MDRIRYFLPLRILCQSMVIFVGVVVAAAATAYDDVVDDNDYADD